MKDNLSQSRKDDLAGEKLKEMQTTILDLQNRVIELQAALRALELIVLGRS